MMIPWLKKWADAQPDKQFLNTATFADIFEQTVQMMERLDNLVSTDSRVALISENSVEMAVVLFALLSLDKEVLLLNTHLTEHELTEQITELGVAKVFVSDQFSEVWADGVSFSELQKAERTPVSTDSMTLDDEKIAVIMNTSATTGKFKSVPITWGMIKNHVKASAETIGVLPEDNWLVVLPMFHVSGLSIIMRSLYNGTAATILPRFDENAVLDLVSASFPEQGNALRTDKINMMSIVPTMLSRFIDRIPQENALRMILLGGEFIPQPLISKAERMGLPVYKTYGMTESFSQSVTFNIVEFPEKITSVGRPLPGVEIEIRNPDDEGIGEIWLRSPMLMKAYLGKAPYGKAFETGDIGYVDADGFLYVLNRRKDIIISGGENIYPKEIEDLVYSLAEVRECAVVPRADATWGQVPVLFVSGALSEDQLRHFLSKKLAKYKLPAEIYFMEELPKNASGKILRRALKP